MVQAREADVKIGLLFLCTIPIDSHGGIGYSTGICFISAYTSESHYDGRKAAGKEKTKRRARRSSYAGVSPVFSCRFFLNFPGERLTFLRRYIMIRKTEHLFALRDFICSKKGVPPADLFCRPENPAVMLKAIF